MRQCAHRVLNMTRSIVSRDKEGVRLLHRKTAGSSNQNAAWLVDARARRIAFAMPSGPILTFTSHRGGHCCEC